MPEGTDRPSVLPQGQFVNHMLIIVSHTHPAQYTYLKHAFAKEAIDVILDRRMGERRWREKRVAAERRRADRRQQDLTEDLRRSGWAMVSCQ